jgi:hypothetical protein
VLKNEWWYWDADIIPLESTSEMPTDLFIIEDDDSLSIKNQNTDTEDILQLLSTNSNELVHRKNDVSSR